MTNATQTKGKTKMTSQSQYECDRCGNLFTGADANDCPHCQTPSYSWDWVDGGVAIFRDGVKIGEIKTEFPSRDGLAIVDALTAAR